MSPERIEKADRTRRGCDKPLKAPMATVLGEEQYRCPWALLAEEDEECVTTLLEMFFDWDTLGLLPFGAARMGDLPAWLVDSFRVCAEVDKIATMKQKMQTQAAMMGASAAGRLA